MLLVLAIVGCNAAPSPSLVENAVRASIDGGVADRAKLVQFNKTDGQPMEMLGVKAYTMTFAAHAQFVADVEYTASSHTIMNNGPSITTRRASGAPITCATSLTACVYGSSEHAKAGEGLAISGTASFEKSEAGWRLTSLDYNARSVLVPGIAQGRTEGLTASEPQDVGSQRCMAFSSTHPVPHSSFLDRLLRRSVGIARTLPDSEINLTSSSSVGSVAMLATGEVCVGPRLVLSTSEQPRWITSRDRAAIIARLSRPDPVHAFRLLAVGEDGIEFIWIVHPDSEKPLSLDALTDYRTRMVATGEPLPNIDLPGPASWAPDGRTVLVHSPRHTGFLLVKAGAVAAPIVSLASLTPRGTCFGGREAQERSIRWTAPDVAEVSVSMFSLYDGYVKERLPIPDSISSRCGSVHNDSVTVLIDASRATATKVR